MRISGRTLAALVGVAVLGFLTPRWAGLAARNLGAVALVNALATRDAMSLDRARAAIELALSRQPDDANSWLNLVSLEIQEGNIERAQEILDRENVRGLARARLLAGVLAIRLGREQEHPQLLRDLGVDRVYTYRAEQAVESRSWQQALDQGRLAVMINPANPNAAFTLAEALYHTGDSATASTLYLRVATGDAPPSLWAAALARLGDLALAANRPLDARQQFRKAVTLAPDDLHVITGLATSMVQAAPESASEARAMLLGAASKAPHYVWLYVALGEVETSAGNYYESLRWYDHAQSIDPENPAALVGLSHVWALLGDDVRAKYYDQLLSTIRGVAPGGPTVPGSVR